MMFKINVTASFNFEDVLRKSEALTAYMQEVASKRVADGIRQSIIDSTSPYGDSFAPLATETIRQRRRRNIAGVTPLIATAEMIRSIRTERQGQITQVKMDGKILYHQFGTSRGVPQRQTIPWDGSSDLDLPEEWSADIEKAFQQFFV